MSARPADAATLRASIEHIEKVRDQLQQALWGVTGGSLVFTCLTVTLFGVKHGVPWFIAWLLEPLVAIALIAVLLGDGVLSNYGEKAPGWAQFLRWFAGLASWTMNVWQSVFFVTGPAKNRVTEFKPDAAGIVLHSIVPLLVILLAESAPRYRRRFSIIAERLRDDLARLEMARSPQSTVPARPASNRATEPRTVPSPSRATEPLATGAVTANRAITAPEPSHRTEPTAPSIPAATKPAEPATVPVAEPVTVGSVEPSQGDRANQANTEPRSDGSVPPELRPGVKAPDYVIAKAREIYELNPKLTDRKLAVATRDHFKVGYAVIGRSACQTIIADYESGEATG